MVARPWTCGCGPGRGSWAVLLEAGSPQVRPPGGFRGRTIGKTAGAGRPRFGRLSPFPAASRQKEAARRFPTGAKVRLSVGGPVMVVDGATADGRVVCRWFDGNTLDWAKL